MPWKPGPNVERKIFPMFSRWKTARTPGIFDAAAASIGHPPTGDGGSHRHRVEHAREVEVRGVLGPAAHLQRPIHARGVTTDRGRRHPSLLRGSARGG